MCIFCVVPPIEAASHPPCGICHPRHRLGTRASGRIQPHRIWHSPLRAPGEGNAQHTHAHTHTRMQILITAPAIPSESISPSCQSALTHTHTHTHTYCTYTLEDGYPTRS